MAEKRTAAIASLGMAGGIGGFIAFPYAHVLIEWLGWTSEGRLLTLHEWKHAERCIAELAARGEPATQDGPEGVSATDGHYELACSKSCRQGEPESAG